MWFSQPIFFQSRNDYFSAWARFCVLRSENFVPYVTFPCTNMVLCPPNFCGMLRVPIWTQTRSQWMHQRNYGLGGRAQPPSKPWLGIETYLLKHGWEVKASTILSKIVSWFPVAALVIEPVEALHSKGRQCSGHYIPSGPSQLQRQFLGQTPSRHQKRDLVWRPAALL
jgi:hypothetical protein